MKRSMRIMVALTVAMMTVFAATGAFAVTSFRLSNQLPPKHYISKAAEVFADKVAEYSDGEMEVKVFHSAQLFKDTEIVEALQEGIVEMGLVPINKWSGMIPAASVFSMPFVFQDHAALVDFINGGADELFDAEFRKYDTKIVFWVDYGFVQFFNSKRSLKKPADFDGLKIRTFSTATADTVKALGGTPAVMSSSEMYMALQRGTVDGATTGSGAAVSRKLYEVQKYMTACNYSAAQFFVQANLQWWDGLSDEQKDILIRAGVDAENWVRNEIGTSEANARKVLAEEGMQIDELTAEERKAFVEATAPVREGFAENSGELGNKLLELLE